MSEISEAAKAKYEGITGYKYAVGDLDKDAVAEHFAHFIQEVSDAVGGYIDNRDGKHPLAPFILPEPVDPLRAALDNIPDEDIREISATYDVAACRNRIADVLTRHGIEIGEARK